MTRFSFECHPDMFTADLMELEQELGDLSFNNDDIDNIVRQASDNRSD